MGRLLLFFLQLAVLVGVAVWVADRPGEVTLRWLGYEITTDVGILLLAVALLMALAALLYHLWRRLVRAPRGTLVALGRRRQRRGWRALTNGFVAVAAGEAEQARRFAGKAESLLNEPALTRLLSAQAAQLNGDEAAVSRHLEAMLTEPETRFLALRGLVQQALRQGDTALALERVEQAYRLRPDTPWVMETLFDLAEREGRLLEASRVLQEARRRRTLPAAEADRRRAVVTYERALAAEGEGQPQEAYDRVRAALRLAPDLTAAAALTARLAERLGRKREAERTLERAWTLQPHPDLAKLYLALNPQATAAERLRLLKRLTGGQPDHAESRLALAEAALAAGLWGEARQQLLPFETEAPDQRAAILLALLAEAEQGDHEAARRWRDKAASLPAPPAWDCGNCGHRAPDWQPRCRACGSFDSLLWKPGPAGLGAVLVGMAPLPEKGAEKPAEKPAEKEAALPAEQPAAPPPPDAPAGSGRPLSPEEAARRAL